MMDIIIKNENESLGSLQNSERLRVFAIASPVVATLGFVVLTIPLLGLLAVFGYNCALFEFLSISPYLATAIELIAIALGIIAVKKLPKKTSVRGVAAAGTYIGSVVFIISALATAYLISTYFVDTSMVSIG